MKPKAVIISENGSDSNWLGTARSLRKQGIHVVRLTPKDWYNSKYCVSFISPHVGENPREFMKFLIKLGKKSTCKDVLFPASDNSLILISKNKEKLKRYFEPIASDWDVTEKIIDKRKTHVFAKKIGIPVPETFVPKDKKEVSKIASEIEYPCIIKPAHSHKFYRRFKTKLVRVDSKKRLIEKYDMLSRGGNKLLIQEEIPGGDSDVYSFGAIFNKDSEPLAVFPGQKLRQYPPHHGVGSFTKSVWNQRLVNLGVRLLKEMRFQGIAGVEFKKDNRRGDFVLLEINGRSWSWNYLATFCGLNLPYITYKDAIGEKQKPLTSFICNFKTGLMWIHLSWDFLSMIKKRNMGEITFVEWLHSILIGKKTFAYLSLRDPLPFLSDIRRGLGMIYVGAFRS